MTVYTIAFPKGGVAKTTSAVELTSYLAERGRRVLAIDLDEQGTMTAWLGFTEDDEFAGTAAGVLRGCNQILEAATAVPSIPGAWALVGTDDLGGVDATQVPDLVTSLRDMLPGVAGSFDDVVIDAPPALSGLTLAALAAADVVVAPVTVDGQAMHQLARFDEVIAFRIGARARPGQRIHAIIPARFDGRRTLDREAVLEMRRAFGQDTLVTDPVREAQVVKDSFNASLPVGRYAPDSKPAQDYARALRRIVEEA